MTDRADLPLAGLRVMELSIAIAAPSAGRALHHLGADVIKVESRNNPDVVRLLGAAWARTEDLAPVFSDTGPYVTEMIGGKRSLGLDLKHPDGIAAAKRVLAHCDVFITNYSAPAIAELGLDEASVRELRPDIIYVILPGFGTNPDTPYYSFLAWGPNQAPLVGLDELTGYPDQEPAGIATVSPPDYFSGQHATLGVLAALEHRDQAAEGTRVEVNQFEATLCMLAPFLAGHALGAGTPERTGNRDAALAPQGVYPCRGDDRWLAIAVDSDAAWRSLCELAGFDDLVELSFAQRRARHDELDERLAAWTHQHHNDELAAWLQEAGVPAHPVLDNDELIVDPQVRSRGWYLVRPSTRFGRDMLMDYPLKLTETPLDTDHAGPCMGEHTDEVLGELAGYSEEDVDKLVAAGAAFRRAEPDVTLRRPYDDYLYVLVPGVGQSDRSPR